MSEFISRLLFIRFGQSKLKNMVIFEKKNIDKSDGLGSSKDRYIYFGVEKE